MTTHIALLRGINVGGHNRIAMADLRDLLESLGFAGARTLLQSGNLVFESDRLTGEALERLLEEETARRLGMRVDYLVRTAAEWARVVSHNPFPDQAALDPGRLLVMFLKAAPREADVERLRSALESVEGPELFQADGRQLYVVYPEGIGLSKLTGTRIEQQLGTRGTGRNWNTVLKLADAGGGG